MAVLLSEAVIYLYRRHGTRRDAARRNSGWNDRVWIEAFVKELAGGHSVLDLGCSGASQSRDSERGAARDRHQHIGDRGSFGQTKRQLHVVATQQLRKSFAEPCANSSTPLEDRHNIGIAETQGIDICPSGS